RRELNLDTAIASVQFKSRGVTFKREVFASPVDQVLVIRLTADKPQQVSFRISMKTPQQVTIESEAPDTLVLRGTNGAAEGIKGALKFEARVRVLTDGGKAQPETNALSVTGANSATVFVAAATSYKSYKDVTGEPEARTKQWLTRAC